MTNDERRRRIAVVNDDAEFLAMVERVLEAGGPYEVFTFKDAETSLAELRAVQPELLLIDVVTASVPSGWELALLAGADMTLGPIPVLVTSPEVPGLGRRVTELREVANVRVISKPFTSDQLGAAVADALPESGLADSDATTSI